MAKKMTKELYEKLSMAGKALSDCSAQINLAGSQKRTG